MCFRSCICGIVLGFEPGCAFGSCNLGSLGYKPACCDSARQRIALSHGCPLGSCCELAHSVALLSSYLGVCASAAHARAPAAHEWDTGAASNCGRRRCGAARPAPATVAGPVSYLSALTSAADAGSNRVFRRRRASNSDSGIGRLLRLWPAAALSTPSRSPFLSKPSRRSGDLLRDPGVPWASSALSWALRLSFAVGVGGRRWSNSPYGGGGGLVGVITTPPAP